MSSVFGVEPSSSIPVAVVDDDPKLRTRLAMQLGEAARASAFGSLAAVDERHPPGTALVVVLGPSYAEPGHLGDVSRLTRARQDVTAIMVVNDLTTEVLQQAIRAGISDVITMPNEPGVLHEAVGRAADLLTTSPSAPGPSAVPAAKPPRGRIITVFSTKGGAGKSFVATNLGVVLARKATDKPVVVIDADLQFGDVAVMLGLTPQHTIIDAVSQIDHLDAELLRSLLVRHESGVLVLPAPIEPAFAESVSLVNMIRIIDLLASFCDYVVIDTPAHFNDIVLGVLEETDDIVLIAGMDIPHIKNTKIGLQTLRLLNIPASKVKLALNRANSKVKLDIADVERTLQMKADFLLPSDIAVPQSINKGVPVLLDSPRSGVARSLERMAESFPAHRDAQAGGR